MSTDARSATPTLTPASKRDFSMPLYDALLAYDRPDLTLDDARRALTTLSFSLASELAMSIDELLDNAKGTPYAGL